MELDQSLAALPLFLLSNLDRCYAFLLLTVRFSALLLFLPGLGGGFSGLAVRLPAALVLALAASQGGEPVKLPVIQSDMLVALSCEFLIGSLIGLIPAIVVGAVHNASQLAATTMGLGAGALFDPSTQLQVSPFEKVITDLTIITFLLTDGYHLSLLLTGSQQLGAAAIINSGGAADLLISQSKLIFETGFILAAPVIVALLLTNFTLGLITRVVSQVNVFIISFPLTILIGVTLTIMCLPKMMWVIANHFKGGDIALVELLKVTIR